MTKRGRNKGQITTLDHPKIRIKELKLDANEPLGPQLARARRAIGFSASAVSRAMGKWNNNNVSHFESGDKLFGNSYKTAILYAKTIGIKKLILIIE